MTKSKTVNFTGKKMSAKICPKCERKLEDNFKFCPECGFDLAKAEEVETKSLIEKNQELRQKEAEAQFRKSLIAVAEAFFAMSKEEREAMVEYVQEKAEEAKRESETVVDKKTYKD